MPVMLTADEIIERKVCVPQNYSMEIANMCRCINGEETPKVVFGKGTESKACGLFISKGLSLSL